MSKSGFNKALEKGTSPQLSEPDWDAIIAICDFVRSGDIKPKYAVDSIMKKIAQDNQTSAQLALQILESLVKNCGPKVHNEVANPSFMEFMKAQAKVKVEGVKAKILELIQCWSSAFRDNSDYRAVTDTYNEMKNSGYSFPVLCEADAMFTSEVPPDWKDGENCFSCRNEFGMITRKHHCRACGQIFCGKCSSKTSMIAKFGIEKEVRVCDMCYNKLNPSSSGSTGQGSAGKKDDSDLPAEYLNSPLYKQSLKDSQSTPPGGKTKEEIEEEEQLQLALAISQSEAEAKEQDKKKRQTFMSLDATPPGGLSGPPVVQPTGPKIELDQESMNPELQKYLNRNYWEQKEKENTTPPPTKQQQIQQQPAKVTAHDSSVSNKFVTSVTTPSAPPSTQSDPSYSSIMSYAESEAYQNGEVEATSVPEEDEVKREEFMRAMSGSIDVFVNRMNSNSTRGRSIINDSAVQTLFATLQNMHPQLLSHIQAQEDKRSHYEGLQDKLAQLRDAREALTSLRQEHEEKRRVEAEERAKRKQIQMMQKLDILRKQKQQALDRQRLAAVQRLQQQEAEMRARMEMQKQQAQMRQMQLHGFPQELQQTGYGQYNPMMSTVGGDYHQMSQYGAPPPGGMGAPLPVGMGAPPPGGMGVPLPGGIGAPGGMAAPPSVGMTAQSSEGMGIAGAGVMTMPAQQGMGGQQQQYMEVQPQAQQQLTQQGYGYDNQLQQGLPPSNQVVQGYPGQPVGYSQQYIGGYQPQPNQQQPPQQQQLPQQQQPPPGNSTMYNNTYNMQGMTDALPSYQAVMQSQQYPQLGGQPPAADMQQTYSGNPSQPAVQQQAQYQQPGYQQQQQGYQQQSQQAPPPQFDSQLISFD